MKSQNSNKLKTATDGNSVVSAESKYDLKEVKTLLGVEMSDQEALDLLFYCPFEFPKYQSYER